MFEEYLGSYGNQDESASNLSLFLEYMSESGSDIDSSKTEYGSDYSYHRYCHEYIDRKECK